MYSLKLLQNRVRIISILIIASRLLYLINVWRNWSIKILSFQWLSAKTELLTNWIIIVIFGRSVDERVWIFVVSVFPNEAIQEVVYVCVIASRCIFCIWIEIIVIVTRRILSICLIIPINEVLSCLLKSPSFEGWNVNNSFIEFSIDFILIWSELSHFSLLILYYWFRPNWSRQFWIFMLILIRYLYLFEFLSS